MEDEEITFTVLDILFKKVKWGGAHISYDKIVRWIGNKVKRNGKRVRKIVDKLIKDGVIISKPTHYGKEISLNPKERERIIEIISKYYKISY
ncbi:MAG: hypothetical protein NTW30_06005 [Candidatus Aenigmarchaeota archaeon]|nr:hypothetical protein [Candidatus Aenigmarchaeota archaeon]